MKTSEKCQKTEQKLLTTAIHEAGHALADYLLGFKTKQVTVVPGNGYAGLCTSEAKLRHPVLEYGIPSSGTRARWHDKIITLLAGWEAQRRFRPQSIRSYMARSDKEAAFGILLRLHPDEDELRAVLKYLTIRTSNLVGNRINWRQIQDLATELVAKKTMTGDEVREALQASFRRQMDEGGCTPPKVTAHSSVVNRGTTHAHGTLQP